MKLLRPRHFRTEVDVAFCAPCYDLLIAAWRRLADRADLIDARYRSVYGITLEDYGRRFIEQCGRCAICGRDHADLPEGRFLVVDHDHATGAVRGLLCSNCNSGIGLLGESVLVLSAAIGYVHRGGPPA